MLDATSRPLAPELNSEYIVGIVMLDSSHINHVINDTNQQPTVSLPACGIYLCIMICAVHWTCGVLFIPVLLYIPIDVCIVY